MSRHNEEMKNPCIKEQFLSFKCLDRNDYDKTKCSDEANNFNLCRSFWSAIQADRKKRKIQPYLPPPEEREYIKEQYMRVFHGEENPDLK